MKIPRTKMTTIEKTILSVVLSAALTACDYAQKREFRHERKDVRYKTAMTDYRAGRLDKAMEAFAELLQSDPANASARFQLACLLQDSKRDFAGAYCQYREYLSQQPDSERSKLARDRMAICEREMAKMLAEKHGIVSGEAYAAEIGDLRAKLKDSEKKRIRLGEELVAANDKVARMEEERVRLLRTVRADTDAEKSLEAPSLKDARALLDDDEETDRVAFSADAKALKLEGEEELAAAKKGPSILPSQDKDAKKKREAARKNAAAGNSRGDRPAEYTVEDGDTLYAIAERFYGRTSAWVEIRNANKAVISVDGRVKAGDRIVLP